jgi:hypothetical protein
MTAHLDAQARFLCGKLTMSSQGGRAAKLCRSSLRLSPARMSGPEVLLEPNTAQALAVTLHELATNAVKYGSL